MPAPETRYALRDGNHIGYQIWGDGPVDVLEFFYLTPLPGSEDHKVLTKKGVAMDPDMNNYDLEHACTAHPIMSTASWTKVYNDAWKRYYSDEHVETIMRRAVATGLSPSKVRDAMTIFSSALTIEGVHPLQFGYVRRKVRTQRRPGMPIVNPLIFYPWRVFDFCRAVVKWMRVIKRYQAMMKRVVGDPAAATYVDEALQPPAGQGELDHFVEVYADKIPKTHGAPVRKAVPAVQRTRATGEADESAENELVLIENGNELVPLENADLDAPHREGTHMNRLVPSPQADNRYVDLHSAD